MRTSSVGANADGGGTIGAVVGSTVRKVVGSVVGGSVGATVGAPVGVSVVGIAVGSIVAVGGNGVNVFGTRVFVRRVNVCVGARVRVGSKVLVGTVVLDGARVGDGIVVCVAGGFVATRTTMRVVGDACGVVTGVVCAHATNGSGMSKKKSERSTFALFGKICVMRLIVATR